MTDKEALAKALDLLSRYYWTQSKKMGAKTDRETARFFEVVGQPWCTRSMTRPIEGELLDSSPSIKESQ